MSELAQRIRSGQLIYEGLPYEGNKIPDIKDADPDFMKPVKSFEAHVSVLNPADPDDAKKYEEICDLAAKRQAQIVLEEIKYDTTKSVWTVFIRWYRLFYVDPSGKRA